MFDFFGGGEGWFCGAKRDGPDFRSGSDRPDLGREVIVLLRRKG
jgi:hypothetical protein